MNTKTTADLKELNDNISADNLNASSRVSKLKDIVTEAGKIALSYYGKTSGREKKDSTIVTEADIQVGRFLADSLINAFPEIDIINEEADPHVLNKKLKDISSKGITAWVVDPIDGTAAFNSRLPIWAVSIGLLEWRKEKNGYVPQPVLGMIHMPVTGEYYYTDKGFPAIFESPYWGKEIMDISDKKDLLDQHSFLCVTSNSFKEVNLTLDSRCRSFGSTAAHFCYVCRGDSSGSLLKGHLWDLVMGLALLKNAGGVCKTITGSSECISENLFLGNQSGMLIIASPANTEKILSNISPVE